METKETVIDTVEMNLDEILGNPGSEDFLVAEEDKSTNILDTAKTQSSLSVLDNLDKDEEEEIDLTDPALEEKKIEAALNIEGAAEIDKPEPEEKGVKKRVDKANTVGMFKALIEKEKLVPFDDGKSVDDYDINDFQELIEANFAERDKVAVQNAREEFFEALPSEFQFAAEYYAKGGNDHKSLFKVLAQLEETKALDPTNPNDSEKIVRQHLQSISFGTVEEIEDEVTKYKDRDELEAKAAQFKPKLEARNQKDAQAKVIAQEQWRKQQEGAARQYMESIYNTLKPGEIDGLKLDKKTQSLLYSGLTEANYPSMSGRPINLFGHLIEKYQYVEPRHDLIAEVLWHLSDPEGFKKKIAERGKTDAVIDTARKLKTEEGKKSTSGTTIIEKEEVRKKSIPRNNNFFKPNF